MEFLTKLDKEIINIDKKLNTMKKNDIRDAINLIKNENKDLLYNLQTLCPDNKKLNTIIREELIKKLIDTYNLVIDKTYEIINELNNNIKEIIIFFIKSPILDDKTLKNIEKIYTEQSRKLTDLNTRFLKIIDQNYDVFINTLTYNNENRINLIIKESKDKIIINLSYIITNKKKELKQIFKDNIIPLIKEIKIQKQEKTNQNEKIVLNYSVNLLDENIKITINNNKENIEEFINNNLNTLNEKIIKITKKNKKEEFNKLKEYLLKFNNTLFAKNEKVLKDMTNILKSNTEEIERKFEEYSDKLDKIYSLTYNFDKIFNNYKEENQNILLNNKSYEQITSLVKKHQEEIEKKFTIEVVTLFKDNVEFVNKLIYKILLIKHKTFNYTQNIDSETIKEYFN